ncbi:unnamed protein product [Echinostoma caproni]|uniref:HET domain-containing protein n=1 Tax=Echinostoma caproni TaxID=27848 RepID=A0A183A559_9TREM|nr:unnamed protein product [Echinostoma caproni]
MPKLNHNAAEKTTIERKSMRKNASISKATTHMDRVQDAEHSNGVGTTHRPADIPLISHSTNVDEDEDGELDEAHHIQAARFGPPVGGLLSSTSPNDTSRDTSMRSLAKRTLHIGLPGLQPASHKALFLFSEENAIRKYSKIIIEWGYPFQSNMWSRALSEIDIIIRPTKCDKVIKDEVRQNPKVQPGAKPGCIHSAANKDELTDKSAFNIAGGVFNLYLGSQYSDLADHA